MLATAFAASSGDLVSQAIAPSVTALSLLASILCVVFIVVGGYEYITSRGNPEKLSHAKQIIKHALVGLAIVLAAALIANFLKSAYGPITSSNTTSLIPNLNPITATSSSGLINIIIKVITGVLGSIINTVAVPFLKALSYFTSGTPLVAANHSVFDLWLSSVGIADALMVLVIILIGLHTMGFLSLGLEQISLRQILPQVGLAFLLINSSIFLIDSLIDLSNLLIKAIGGNGAAQSVWNVLSTVVKQSNGYSLAALIIMAIFLVFSVILLIYYVGRIVTIYLGAILAPLVILCWLLPSLRDIAVSAAKRYFSAIFVLFIHVIILQLAASLLAGMISNQNPDPNPLMAMVVGLATLVALLKTQGVMNQLSYATIGPRMTRQIARRLVLNVSYLSNQASSAISTFIPGRESSAIANTKDYSFRQPRSINTRSEIDTSPKPNSLPPTENKKDEGKKQ